MTETDGMRPVRKLRHILSWFSEEVSALPLVVFRFAFGIMMFAGLVRFAANGWIDALYAQPSFFFTFYGFEWIKPLNAGGMYVVFGMMMLASLLIAFTVFYRIGIISFFLLFTYVELIDKTNYLNHYYFISLMSFLLCLLPAEKQGRVPRWALLAIQVQMAVVYFFAGLAKVNSDWLLHAQPLKIWLTAKTDLPLVGLLLGKDWVAFAFSWCGMLFDVCIAFFLFNRKTVWYAYTVVVVFHTLTAILFPGIGMFPYIMMVCATVFLPASFHERVMRAVKRSLQICGLKFQGFQLNPAWNNQSQRHLLFPAVVLFFIVQLALPFRYLLYPDHLFWHEQGYRFSWRVMLMEKAGTVFFHVKNKNGQLTEVSTADYLSAQQEKQMSTQPDMILQFAHHLAGLYESDEVYAEAYVAVNGRASRLLIDPKQNLCAVKDDLSHKQWITAANEMP